MTQRQPRLCGRTQAVERQREGAWRHESVSLCAESTTASERRAQPKSSAVAADAAAVPCRIQQPHLSD